jgi:hypothetical protein
MKKITVLFIILIPLCCFGQARTKVDRVDSLSLITLTKKFREHVVNRDGLSLKAMSFDKIHCVSCTSLNFGPPPTYLLPVDTFINVSYHSPLTLKLIGCIESNSPWINIIRVNGGEFEDKELKKIQVVFIYEVFYLTTKPNEIEVGHEGQETALQFIKVNNGFKLYGLTTVP